VTLGASGGQGAEGVEGQGHTLVARLNGPDELVLAPQGHVLVVPGGGVQLVIRMGGQAPQLPPVAKHHLGEAALQRALQDVVPRGAHVDVPVVPPGALRIDGSHAASGLGELRIQKGQLNIRPLWESIILYCPYKKNILF